MANFRTYGLNYWETVEDRWVRNAAMRLTSIKSSIHPVCEIRGVRRGQTPQKYEGPMQSCNM